jgi:ABC-type transport system substrate-binding protein
VNRQRRALLTIAILALLLVPFWLARRSVPDGGNRTAPSAIRPAIDPETRWVRIAPPVRGGTLMATARSEPQSFNRIAANLLPTEIFMLLTQGRLVRINRASWKVEPWLAESWTTSPDKLTYTLTLRDLKWSDGVPFTSADVVFSLEAAYAKGSAVGGSILVGGKPLNATAVDARTVAITYPSAFAPGIRLLDNLPIYPKHKLEGALRVRVHAGPASDLRQKSQLLAQG